MAEASSLAFDAPSSLLLGPLDSYNTVSSDKDTIDDDSGSFGVPSLLMADSSSDTLVSPPCPNKSDSFGAPSSLLIGSTQVAGEIRVETGNDEAEFSGFVLGGLLGGGQREASEDVDMDADEAEEAATRSLPPDSASFRPNGLLSESISVTNIQAEESQQSITSLSQSQDDEFPDASELLRPYQDITRSRDTHSATTSAAASVVRAKTFDGKPVYMGRRVRRSGRTALMSTGSGAAAPGGSKFGKLLDVPIHRLMDQLSTATAEKLAHDDAQGASSSAVPAHKIDQPDASLWVDRYRPKCYADLLGDDRVHREVLAWVKEWDQCVFGRNKGKGKKRARPEDGENVDEWRRPQEKILLLSGPPGLGKTTLAHVVAQHAGYNVFEINASDARSAQIVEDRIRPALESGSAIGSSKPSLVVIDEIDGATGGSDHSSGFIQKLISMTFEKPKKKGRKNDPKSSRPLLRPIICICNDLYASSLAKLRPIARIVRFSRPNDVHLVRRLRDVCANEGLRADSRALTALVGMAQGDLRGCLNTLQLLKARGKEVTEPAVRRATAGMKEAEASLTTVLNDLFSPLSRKRAKELGLTEDDEARYIGRLSREVEGTGAMDRVAQGCFEHYANLHQHDANFERYMKGQEWLSAYDIMSGEMRSEREYALMQYLSYPLVAFYPLFQERGGPKVERPKADWENYQKTKMSEEIYKTLARGLRTASTRHMGDFRHLASNGVLQLEFAPLINRIISPPIRPVNSQVIRPGERILLSRLVDIMVAMELRFIQEKAEDGQLVYRLDPPIDVFVTYDGKRASDISVSRYAVRHLVAAEIDAKLISRDADSSERYKRKSNFFRKASDEGEEAQEDTEEGDAKLTERNPGSDAVPRKRARQAEMTEKVATDFFGRPILVPKGDSNKPVSGHKTAQEQKYRVTYRFNEGNSAAVRKPVKVDAFL